MFDIAMSCGFKKDGVLTDKAWDFLAEYSGKKQGKREYRIIMETIKKFNETTH